MAKTKKMAFGGMGSMPSQPLMNASGGQYKAPSWQEARSNFRDARAAGQPNMPSMHDFRQQFKQRQGLGGGMAPPGQMLQASGPTGYVGPQSGGPGPMSMATTNPSQMGMFKKGGSVKTTRFAEGGGVKEMHEPPIPKATQESMKRQAEQEKADRQQAKEQKAGEKEVKENMGRLGFKKGGSVSSASKRADGCAIRGKTRA